MLTFFRKIRRSLLDEQRFHKYIVYALGEILLVVIGILIALQVNNWNQTRLDRILEKNILIDLKNEFQENKAELEEKQMIRDWIINATTELNEIINGQKLPDNVSKIDSLLNFSTYVATYDPRNGVLDNLLNSGQINLIQNKDLKILLTNWKGALAELQEHEQVSYEFTLSFATMEMGKSYSDFRRHNKFNATNYLEGKYNPLPVGNNIMDHTIYLTSPSIINYISAQNDINQFAKMEAVEINNIIIEILELINMELSHR